MNFPVLLPIPEDLAALAAAIGWTQRIEIDLTTVRWIGEGEYERQRLCRIDSGYQRLRTLQHLFADARKLLTLRLERKRLVNVLQRTTGAEVRCRTNEPHEWTYCCDTCNDHYCFVCCMGAPF